MSDDPIFEMYKAQAELVETKQELERIRRENDELKNQMTANNLIKTVDDFQKNNSNRFEAMEENLRRLTTTISSSDQILSEINETLRKQNDTLEKQNKDIQILKTNMKTMEKETILLLGGRKAGNVVMDSLLILENNGNWEELSIKLPYAVYSHGAQFLNNYLYIYLVEKMKKTRF